MIYEFICHSTDTQLFPKVRPKGIRKHSIVVIENGKYFVNDILRKTNLIQYSLLKVIK